MKLASHFWHQKLCDDISPRGSSGAPPKTDQQVWIKSFITILVKISMDNLATTIENKIIMLKLIKLILVKPIPWLAQSFTITE